MGDKVRIQCDYDYDVFHHYRQRKLSSILESKSPREISDQEKYDDKSAKELWRMIFEGESMPQTREKS